MANPRSVPRRALLNLALIAVGVTGLVYGQPHASGGEYTFGYGPGGALAFYLGATCVGFGLVGLAKCHRYLTIGGLILLGGIIGSGICGTMWVSQHQYVFAKGSPGPTPAESREMRRESILGLVAGGGISWVAYAVVAARRKTPAG